MFSGFSVRFHGCWLPIALLPALALALLILGRAQGQQDGPNRAGLVIRYGDGRVVTACVSFSEPSISGFELLQRSGIPYIAQQSGMGAAVCKIDGEGCDYPTEDCFCKRNGPTTIYWAYSRLTANGWVFSPLGASSTRVQPGDVNGWAWGTGSVASGAQPPIIPFDQVCQVQASTPIPPTSASPMPSPTATPQPPTATPVPPTATPLPTPLPTDTPQPTATPQLQSAPAAPTNTPVPTRSPASPTATNLPNTPTRTLMPPTATRPPPTPLPTAQPVAPTVPSSPEVPELAQAATSAPTPLPPSATSVPSSAVPATPTRAAQPTSMPTNATQSASAVTETRVAAAPTQAVVSSPVATAEGAGGAAPQQPAVSQNPWSSYVPFVVLVLALISAILAIYSRRVR